MYFVNDDDYIGISDEMYSPETELLGGPFAKLFKRIRKRVKKGKLFKKLRKRIKARIAARRKGRGASDYEIRTPRGGLKLGPGGIDITSPDIDAQVDIGPQPAPGIMDTVMKNPVLLAVPAGLILFLALRKRR